MRVDTRPHDRLRGRQVALGTAGHRALMGCDAPEPMGLGEREWFHSLQVDAPGEQGPALGSSPASCPCASISPGESLGRELGLLRSWAALEVGSGQTWGCQASPHILPERGGSGLCPIPRQRELGKEQAEGKQGGPAWSQPSRSRPQGTVPPHRAPPPCPPDLRDAPGGAVTQSLSHVWVGSGRAVTRAAWTDVDKAVSWAVSTAPRVGQLARPHL